MKIFLLTILATLVLAASLWSQAATPKPGADYVVVIPEPDHPKLVSYTSGMTLLGAVAAVGFNEFGDTRHVVLIRCGKKEVIDVRSLRNDPSKDFVLTPWDIIYFRPTLF